jgi:transglutaminase-like putative cysteine protease
VLKPAGVTRVWLPTPPVAATPYQKPTGPTAFHADGGTARMAADARTGAAMIAAEWPDGIKPVLSATSRVAPRDYAVDVTGTARAPEIDKASLARYLQPTSLLPIDGIVKSTAAEITTGARTDVAKARAIYEWIVENTSRDPKVLGCGIGFGSWEMNWIGYNDAHDVTLPGSSRATVPFFMYPQAETDNGRINPLDPDDFKYRISAHEVS